MEAKTINMSMADLKDLLNDVYSKAVNSYYDLREITVEETLQKFIQNFNDKTSIQLPVPESLEQKVKKNSSFITLDHPSPYQISSNTTLVNYGTDSSFCYNPIVFPTSTYYNPIDIVANNQSN